MHIPVAPPQVLFPSCLILHTKTGWYIDVPLTSRYLCFMQSLIMDIVDALDKLDIDHSIPLIFCEAADLLKLPSLCTSKPLKQKLDTL